MISFDAAMEKAEEMRRNAHEALRDLPEVSEVLNGAHLTDDQRQAMRVRLQPIREAQDALDRAINREGPGGATWEQPPERVSSGSRLEAEHFGGSTWEQPSSILSEDEEVDGDERDDGVSAEGPGGSRW